MSAIATVLAAMGHRVTGSDLKDVAGLDRLRRPGVDVARRPRRRATSDDVDVGRRLDRDPATNPEVRGRPRARASRCCAGPRCWPPSPRRGARSPSPAPTARRRPRRCSPWCCRRPACDPSFIIGGELNEIGTGAVWDDGDWLVVEADESDGTFLELGAEVAVVTNVEPDHLEHYGGFEPLSRRPSTASSPPPPGPAVVVRRRPEARPRSAGRHGAVTYGTADGADYRIGRRPRPTARAPRSTLVHDGAAARATSRLPVPGAPQRPQRRAPPLVAGLRARRAVRGAPCRALARFAGVARRFQFRGEVDGVTFVDDYAHLPTEVAAALAAAPGRRLAPGRRASSSPTATAAPRPCGRDFADAFVDADVLVVTDVYARGRGAPAGRHRASWSSTRCSTRRPEPRRSSTCPGRDDLVAFLRRPAAAGRPLPDPRRRRPHLAARRAPGRAGAVGRDRRPLRGPRPRRLPASAPRPATSRSGPLTTYRVGGPAAPVRRRRPSRGRPAALAGPPSPASGRRRCWSWARGRTCSSPTPASPGWPSRWATGFAGHRDRRHATVAGRRRRRPAGARPPDAPPPG